MTPDTREEAAAKLNDRSLGYRDILRKGRFRHGYIKCRLVHMIGKSFVLPDVLMASGLKKTFFSPNFFQPNQIVFLGGDGSNDHCKLVMELIGQVDAQVVFFKNKLVKHCADGSLIYKCAYQTVGGEAFPEPQGTWRNRENQFELALYHHTDEKGKAGILESKDIWSSAWNIQGTTELKNIAYGYFTSLPTIKNEQDLREIAMSSDGKVHFLPTNASPSGDQAKALNVYRQSTDNRKSILRFWINVETIAVNHLWCHQPTGQPVYYEIVLPKIFRIGVSPGETIPINGTSLSIEHTHCKSLQYAIVGDANTANGLVAPYVEEETTEIAKIDLIAEDQEIIGQWYERQNSNLYDKIEIELAELIEERL